MIIGYARVSTLDQNLSLQKSALIKAGCEKIYEEKVSSLVKRPALEDLMHNLRKGDTLIVWKLDRLARSIRELLQISETLKEKEVRLESLQEKLDTTSATGRLYYNLLSLVAEFERDLIKERVRAGIAEAQANGIKVGKPKGLTKQAKAKALTAVTLYTTRSLSISEIARQLQLNRTSVYKYLKLHNIPLRQEKYVVNNINQGDSN